MENPDRTNGFASQESVIMERPRTKVKKRYGVPLAKRINQFIDKPLYDSEQPRISQSVHKAMSQQDQLALQLDQTKEDLNIEEVDFKEVHSQWDSDISDELYSDFFNSDLFFESTNQTEYRFERGSMYYKQAQKAMRKQARKAQRRSNANPKDEKAGRSNVKQLMLTQQVNSAFLSTDAFMLDIFKNLLLQQKLEQFNEIRRELVMRARLERHLCMHDHYSFKIINKHPE